MKKKMRSCGWSAVGGKKAIAIVASIAALAYVGLAFAEENVDNNQDTTRNNQERKTELGQKREIVKAEWEQRREQWKTDRTETLEKFKQEKERLRSEYKEKFTAERCAKIEEKIGNRTVKFDSSKVKHMSVYNNLLARLDKFIKRFEDFNTASVTDIGVAKIAKLKDDRAQLVVLIDAFKASYDEYSAKLTSTKNFTCGNSEGEFRGSLVDTRAYLKAVYTNASEIRKFVRTEILPDILTAKQEMAKIKGETESKDNTTTDNQ